MAGVVSLSPLYEEEVKQLSYPLCRPKNRVRQNEESPEDLLNKGIRSPKAGANEMRAVSHLMGEEIDPEYKVWTK